MAIEIIPDKICSHCGGNEWYTTYPKDRKIRLICVLKKKEDTKKYLNPEVSLKAGRKWKLSHPEKSKEFTKKWRNNNKEHYLKNLKNWQIKNKEKNIEYNKKVRKKYWDLLTDSFIKNAINKSFYREGIKIGPKDFSNEDIKLYREGLIANRMFKKFKTQQLETQQS